MGRVRVSNQPHATSCAGVDDHWQVLSQGVRGILYSELLCIS